MGMAEDELLHRHIRHIVQIEPTGVRLDAGVEQHLHQHVPQLLLEQGGVLCVNGLCRLVGFLQQVAPDGLMGLFLIPGTAAWVAEDLDHLTEIRQVVMFFLWKGYHSFPSYLTQ